MNRNQSKASQTVTLKRRIDTLKKSIERIEADLFIKPIRDGELLCLKVDCRRLADYCAFILESRLKTDSN